jgi:hypothetical protein
VTATLALVVALGGTAAAADYVISRNAQLGPGTVAGSAAPKAKHDNVIDGSIAGADLHAGSVRGDKVADRSIGPNDLAPSVSPIAYGQIRYADTDGDDVCSAPNVCPLTYNRNVTGVYQPLVNPGGDRWDGYFCITVRGATPAGHPMIAGVTGSGQGEGVSAVPQRPDGFFCPASQYVVKIRIADGTGRNNIPFWFAVL